MLTRFNILISIAILMMISSVLFCQAANNTMPDSVTVKVIDLAQKVVPLLYNNDYAASCSINWEYFIYNGVDYSDDFWDAWDWEEEDYFIEDMISMIAADMHYEGDADDKFGNWTSSQETKIYKVKCNNKKRSLELFVKLDSYGKPHVSELNIKEIE